MFVTSRLRRIAKSGEAGFTLPELLITMSIITIIAVPLSGIVIEYFKTTVSTQARLSESHDVQFAAAYWQRDVASIGVRSNTYNNADAVHTFPLTQSVSADGSLAACALPAGTKIITLAWSSYALDASTDPSQTVTTVTYVSKADPSTGTSSLTRVACSGSTVKSTVKVANHLTTVTAACSGGGVSGCGDSSGAVPTRVTLTLTSTDPDNDDGTTYQQTLLGERRQT